MESKSLLKAYRRMVFIRVVGRELVKFYLENKVFSMVHFYIGQEAVAVGVCDALGKEDKVLGNHRSHGHYLAKGGDLTRMVAELFGRENGCSHGNGGSMHMIDKSVNFMGSTPLLGSVAPIATGVAFAEKYRGKDSVTVAFYGDGASEEGVVYESYNLASLYKVPILFVIENNLFSINSKIKDRRAVDYDISKIVSGLGALYMRADGNNYEDVFSKASKLVEAIRENKRPAVLECMTYRHMAHSTPLMEENYREEDTVENRVKEDPLSKVKARLVGEGVSEQELMEIEEEAKKEILKSIEIALNSSYPPKENLYKEMYA